MNNKNLFIQQTVEKYLQEFADLTSYQPPDMNWKFLNFGFRRWQKKGPGIHLGTTKTIAYLKEDVPFEFFIEINMNRMMILSRSWILDSPEDEEGVKDAAFEWLLETLLFNGINNLLVAKQNHV